MLLLKHLEGLIVGGLEERYVPSKCRRQIYRPISMNNHNQKPASIRRVLEPLFGKRWPLAIFLIPIIVGWPIAVFYDLVAFDAAHFVEEWIKLSLTTFIFYLIIEIVQERKKSALSRLDFETFLHDHVSGPLREAISQLELVAETLNPGSSQDVSDQLLTACRYIEHVGGALASAGALSADLSYARDLARISPARVARYVQAISDLARNTQWGAAAIDDLNKMIGQIKELKASFNAGEDS